jgi:hypothetical protein
LLGPIAHSVFVMRRYKGVDMLTSFTRQ